MKNIIKVNFALIITTLLCGSAAMGAPSAPTPNVTVSWKNPQIHKYFNDTAVTPFRIERNGRIAFPHIILLPIHCHTMEPT
jgi:hypothetical protein